MGRAQILTIVCLLWVLAQGLAVAPDATGDDVGGGTMAASGAQGSQPPNSSGTAPGSGETVAVSAAQPSPSPAPSAHEPLVGVAQASLPAMALPSQSPTPSAHELPTIVVTATRLSEPLSQIGTTVTVVNHSQIESQKIEQVNDALRQVPGVELTQSGSPGTLSDVFIRGATPAQTLILIDGVEVNTGATGSFDLANLTTDNLDRIEVVRGAGGALYGSQAVGGVINFISNEGQGPPRFSLLSEGGTRATERQSLTFSGSENGLGYSGALSYFSTTGFRPINDSHDDLSGALRLDYRPDAETTVRGFARYIRSNLSLVNFSNFVEPIDPDAHQRNEFMLFKGEVERSLGDRLTARINASYVRNELRLNDFLDPGHPVFESDDIPEEIRGANLEAVYAWSNGFHTLAGFDFKDRWARSGDHSTGFGSQSITVFRARRQEYAGYVEQEVSLLDGHLLGAGGFRADGNSNFGQEVSPSWNVAIPFSEIGLTLRGSYSEGFRAPSFDELFFPGFGNPDLGPEVSSEYDGGVTKTFGELASFGANYFSRRVHGLIVTATCAVGPGCPFGVRAGNAGRVDVQGVELIPSIRPWPGWSLGGNFTVLDATHAAGAARPTRVPKHSAAGLLQYAGKELVRPRDRLTVSLAYTFVGDRDDIDNVSFAIRNHVGYHRLDAVVSYAPGLRWYRIEDEEVFARVRNIFDRNYSEAFGFKAPPINAVAGVKLDF
jgi:vitamin B12 transporter